MTKELPKWLSEAIERVKAENVKVLADTPEKAQEYGVRLGDTVNIRVPPMFPRTAQQGLDDYAAKEYLRNNWTEQ